MIYEEAKMELECLAHNMVGEISANIDPLLMRSYESVDLAINAIEKQIPKKPFDTQKEGYYSAEFNFACPSCSTWFTYKHKYCPYCGQAIDWSEE